MLNHPRPLTAEEWAALAALPALRRVARLIDDDVLGARELAECTWTSHFRIRPAVGDPELDLFVIQPRDLRPARLVVRDEAGRLTVLQHQELDLDAYPMSPQRW